MRSEGYQTIICQTNEDPDNEIAAVEALLTSRVAGIIASISKRTINFNHYLNAKSKGIPVVLFDRSTDQLDLSHVVIDDFLGSYKAVKHLINQGCTRIAHFTSPQKINIYKERLRGYCTALSEHNIPFLEELVIESELQLEDGRKSMNTLLRLQLPPDGIFSSSDLGAIGALQVLKENNITVPEQVAICGFSNEPFTLFCDPPISSVEQHSRLIGKSAAELFLNELLQESKQEHISKKIILSPELIIRKSSNRNGSK